jgi:hypothetical protein
VSVGPELSSLATALDDLAARITRITEGLPPAERESYGADLYEVERTLQAAGRRLAKVVQDAR